MIIVIVAIKVIIIVVVRPSGGTKYRRTMKDRSWGSVVRALTIWFVRASRVGRVCLGKKLHSKSRGRSPASPFDLPR